MAAIPACSGGRVKVDMPGTWSCFQVEIYTTFDFLDDGTFTKSVQLARDLPKPAPLSGTWKLDNDLKLHLKFKSGEEEVHQVIINAGIPSFAGDADQIFYKKK
jgi:hypothetical protein